MLRHDIPSFKQLAKQKTLLKVYNIPLIKVLYGIYTRYIPFKQAIGQKRRSTHFVHDTVHQF